MQVSSKTSSVVASCLSTSDTIVYTTCPDVEQLHSSAPMLVFPIVDSTSVINTGSTIWLPAAVMHKALYRDENSRSVLYIQIFAYDLQVQNLWRTAYKLTKQFQQPEFRGPLKASRTIKQKLETFKINMPLINCLCNPGLKDRHWQLMGQKVWMDL